MMNERFGSLSRTTVGAVIGPLVFLFVFTVNPFDIPVVANSVLAGTFWVVIWWVTEPVHIAVTSLLPIPLFTLTGVVEPEAVMAQYAHPIVFLLLGGFILALAVERCGLHRRIAVGFVARIGNAPERLVLGVMAVSGFLSMWISNTATTLLMLPIAIAIVLAGTEKIPDDVMVESDDSIEEVVDDADVPPTGFELALLLGVAYGASIGGAATLIGSTPSAIFAGIATSQLDISVGFVDWMLYAVPIVLISLVVAWQVILYMTDPTTSIDEASIRRYRDALPSMGSDERRVSAIFGVVIAAWLVRPFLIEPVLPVLSDPVIAVLGGIALFVVPSGTEPGERLLDWEDTVELPWGVIILIGGSFAVALAFQEGNLDSVIASSLSGLGWLSAFPLVVLVVAAVVIVSNLMSNTATVTVFLPILVAFAPLTTAPPIVLMAPAALAASFVFVLPVATPPNAIAYGSGYVDLSGMVRVGIVLNLVCVPLVAVLSFVWLPIIQPFG